MKRWSIVAVHNSNSGLPTRVKIIDSFATKIMARCYLPIPMTNKVDFVILKTKNVVESNT